MKNISKVIALLLVLAMIVPLLISCGKSSGGGKSNGTGIESDTIVPDDVKFEGEKFTILCREDNAWGNFLHEVKADEDATELVNEQVYKRNAEVESRFGLTLDIYAIAGQWAAKDEFVNTFKNSILSNSSSFDLIMGYQAYMADPGLTELYANFNEVPYVKDNLGASYYFQDIIKEMTVNNKLFFLVGDYNLTYWEYLYVMYFNKKLAENYQLEDLYALVKDGKWTYDKMVEMTKGVFTDMNGDAYPDPSDQFGYISDIPNVTDAFYSFFNVQPTSRDENNDIVISIDQAKMVEILEKVIAFKKSDDTYFDYSYSSQTTDEKVLNTIFQENRALFYPETLSKAQDFRGMETDFGIIPYPKWNENQEGYYTQSQNGYSVAVVPIDVKNMEMTGAVLDVMNALSNKNVIPAYYDQALKSKYARDDQSGEMLDLIRDGFKLNFGYSYYAALGMGGIFRELVQQENSNFVSYYAVNSKGYERNLKKILKTYEDQTEE